MKPVSNKIFSFELPTTLSKSTTQLISVCVMSAALAACGGSSGGTSGGEMDGGSDPDPMDEIPTIVAFGNFTPDENDVDGDGLWEDEEIQLGLDPNDADSDGDGIFDGDEDNDGDLISNYDEITGSPATDPTVANVDVTEPTEPTPDLCIDPDSSNPSWNDNCQLRRFGTYANSLYTRGAQRILHCQGFGSNLTIEAYSDGKLGENTAQDIRDFQTANNLASDGIIGPRTWGALFSKLNAISGDLDIGGTLYSQWSIDGCDAFTAQFYQEVTAFGDLGGWKMASTPGSNILVNFSSETVD